MKFAIVTILLSFTLLCGCAWLKAEVQNGDFANIAQCVEMSVDTDPKTIALKCGLPLTEVVIHTIQQLVAQKQAAAHAGFKWSALDAGVPDAAWPSLSDAAHE